MRFPCLSVLVLSTLGQAALAQAPIPPKDEQITLAVLPLPENLRASARVIGYDPSGKFVELRAGSGMVCLAQYPKEKGFHVSCYHESMEPFMARGRELRAAGTPEIQVDTVRFAEAKAGKLKLPSGPAICSICPFTNLKVRTCGPAPGPAPTTISSPGRPSTSPEATVMPPVKASSKAKKQASQKS